MTKPEECFIYIWQKLSKYLLSYTSLFWSILFCAAVHTIIANAEEKSLLSRIPFYLSGFTLAYAIAVIGRKYRLSHPNQEKHSTAYHPTNKGEFLKLTIIVSISYTGLLLLLYCAWFKGDDYAFWHSGCGLRTRLGIWWQSYLTWVSRSGEFVAHILGCDRTRWQVFILVPLVTTLAPFFLHRLTSGPEQSICSPRGRVFYVFCISLLLLSTDMHRWRIFYCFAASMNYLFPGIFAFLLLSYYNPRRWSAWQSAGSARRIIQYCLIIILSVYVCWGGESLSFIVISSLTVWFACRMRNKLYIPGICWLGYMGAISGATMLFAAPALASRSKIDAAARALDVFSMNCDQLKEFVANLSLEKINLLKGSSGIIVLDGIPLWQHVYFLPHLITKYSICSAYILLTIGILLIMLLTNQKKTRRQHLYIIITGISISLLGACAYLYSCIPTSMSFAPATFTLIAVISYIYWNCEIQKNTLTIISGIVACICMIHLIPAGIEAWIYKPYEKQRFTEIHSQKSAGAQHLILPAPYPEAPRDSLGLISRSDLKEDPKVYPNVIASDKLHVKSISQHPCPPRAQIKP